jgi:hypothetical protein
MFSPLVTRQVPRVSHKVTSNPLYGVKLSTKTSTRLCWIVLIEVNLTHLTFKNRASYIQDGRTATLQMLHFILFFQQL